MVDNTLYGDDPERSASQRRRRMGGAFPWPLGATQLDAWDQLRLTRSLPPGAARKGDAAARYRAALQQSEDLMRAARVAGPAARPLPLFYCLSQAGMAIEACYGVKPTRSHGLAVPHAGVPILATLVDVDERRGRFQSVSKCLRSPVPSGAIVLGALMASLPELASHLPDGNAWPNPLQMVPVGSGLFAEPGEGGAVLLVTSEEIPDKESLKRLLEPYPVDAELWSSDAGIPTHVVPQGGRWYTTVADRPVPEQEYRGSWWLRPEVRPKETPPIGLMTWWLLTFSLSSLARYHPKEWVKALDLDQSREAVVLERAMSEAMDAIPELVLYAVLDA